MKSLPFVIPFLLLLSACGRHFDPKKTFTVEETKADYTLMRQALEEAHPGLTRYTSPDSMKLIFDQIEQKLDHNMSEREFRRVINPVFAFVRCGHTDVYPSKGYARYFKKNKPKEFPITPYWAQNKLLIWQNRSNDSTLKAGTEIVRLDGKPVAEIIADIRLMIPSDGYNQTYKNVLINNSFGSFYRYLYGNNDTFKMTVKDSTGQTKSLVLSFNKPIKVTKKLVPVLPNLAPVPAPALPKSAAPEPRLSKADLRRNLRFSGKDSSVAILDINTFKDKNYAAFYRRTFRKLQKKGTKNLVIDLRNNGGGRSSASIKLMSYLLDSNYVVYKQVDAPVAKPSFNRHLGWKFIRLGVRYFDSKRTPTGGLLNRATGKTHQPAKRNHFNGKVFVITNGGSFSASAIFASIVQQHGRAKTIGRETGGGRNGCNAFVSPMLTLPHTQVRVRMPMFKIVLDIPTLDIGHGVMPDYPVEFTFNDANKGRDLDMEKALELIK